MAKLNVNLAGVELDNPIIPASGTYGFGYEFADLYDINILGAISIKGTTKEPRFGNPTPRIAETPSGMLNAVGLQNPGIEKVISEEIPHLRSCYGKPIIANISGFSIEEYEYCCERMTGVEQVEAIELNISCPNVHGGGMAFGADPVAAARVTAAVRKKTDLPLIVKLSPNTGDITAVAKACEAEGADGLCVINTLLGMRIDLKRKKPILANKTGGLSGGAIFPVALAMIYRVYEAVKIPIVGSGGAMSAADVIEMMLAGATAVEIGAANLVEPYACKNIIEALPTEMERYGIESLSDIIGAAH